MKVKTFGDGIRDEGKATAMGQIANINIQVGALSKAFKSMQFGYPSAVAIVRYAIFKGIITLINVILC